MKWITLAGVIWALACSIHAESSTAAPTRVRTTKKPESSTAAPTGVRTTKKPESSTAAPTRVRTTKKPVEPCRDKIPIWCLANADKCHVKWLEHVFKKICRLTCGFCTPPPPEPPTFAPTTRIGPTTPIGPTGTFPPYTGKCGQPEVKGVRVVGGTTPPRGAWPWQVLLTYMEAAFCGGTLIAPNWVVTAGHCVFGREDAPRLLVVRVGEYDRRKIEGSEENIEVSKIFRYPMHHVPTSLNNDIALLKLSRPAKMNKFVQPACLPSQDPPIGSKCYITGWGKIHHPGKMNWILQQGLLPVVSNEVCYEKNRHRIHTRVTDAMICGGSGGTTRVSGCHGDSGGPFVCNINGKWELHGSVSYGSPSCDSTETYTVFSRTNHFKRWIKNLLATE